MVGRSRSPSKKVHKSSSWLHHFIIGPLPPPPHTHTHTHTPQHSQFGSYIERYEKPCSWSPVSQSMVHHVIGELTKTLSPAGRGEKKLIFFFFFFNSQANCAVIPLIGEHPLSLMDAFRRVWELLSAGLFLPGSIGIPDPCEVRQQQK